MTALMTTAQAAERLGTTPKAVRKLIRSGHLRAVDITTTVDDGSKHSPRYRVTPDALERFLARRATR